jgi:hypothetical protein
MIHLYPLIFALGINATPTTGLRFGAVEGTWDGTFRPSMVHLYMRIEEPRGPNTFGRTFLLDDLTNVRREKRVIGFELKHEAGTFRFDGDAAEIRANGTFQFIPSASYRRAVQKLGYTKPDRHQQLTFALYDVTLDELRYMRKVMTRRIASGELVALLTRGVTPEYVRDLAGVGFPRLAPERLLRLRERGIDASYVRNLRAAGLMLSELDDFVKARNAGLTPEYVSGMTGIGLRNLSLDEYIMLHQADVTAEYAAAIFELGYNSCDITDLVRMRNLGLTAAYIRKASDQAGETLSLAELIRYRSRGEY